MRGRSLDGTQIARRGAAAARAGRARPALESTFDEPFHISAKLERVALRGGIAIAPFALDVTGVADRPATMTLVGRIGEEPPRCRAASRLGATTAACSSSTSDIGSLARGLFGFTSMKGGRLDLRATLHGSAASVRRRRCRRQRL